MTVTSEDMLALFFMAGMGAFFSFVVLLCSKRAKVDMNHAFALQSVTMGGVGFLSYIGAGLTAPPDYPLVLVPVVFLVVLLVSHALWRWAYPKGS